MSREKAEVYPLSWTESRSRLRKMLEAYLKEPVTKLVVDRIPTPTPPSRPLEKSSLLALWIRNDLDLYAGALLLSAALLALSCMAWLARIDVVSNEVLKSNADIAVYKTQLAASCLLLTGAALSLWMIRSRHLLWHNDCENAKRRIIRSFIRRTNRCVTKSDDDDVFTQVLEMDKLNLFGTSLNDSYPVYRISSWQGKTTASWSRVPSLLLVEGDFIALQIGDISPASCEVPRITGRDSTCIRFEAGDCVSSASFLEDYDNNNKSKLPAGRSTIQAAEVDHFLSLCNGMRVFVVTEAPLEKFVRKPNVTPRSSEASRKVQEVRKLLYVVALICLFATAFILFVRPGVTAGDLSLVLPLPLLAALGVLPVVGPAFLFFAEMIGTARIMAHVHKYAAPNTDETDAAGIFSKSRLLVRYVLATLLSRLSLWQVFIAISDLFGSYSPFHLEKEKLVRIPPVSQCLLEKLGVATCFSIIDDQIACEPHAIPQQLLIPSARGLKLLDLCLTYDSDSDNDTDDSERSSSDSSENETTAKFLSIRRRNAPRRPTVRKAVARLEAASSEDLTENNEGTLFVVQFEEPNWWQYLPTLKCIGLASLVIDDKADLHPLLHEESASSHDHALDALVTARARLAPFVCCERRSHQLRALAQCIGFSSEPNLNGSKGDLSPFAEKRRLHILSNELLQKRLEIDAHERSSEQSRWWGFVRPDSTSVVLQDERSQAYQLLTAGDPNVVMGLCHEAWQGEISTVSPLSNSDRQTVLETTNDWKLADLDVAAFAYSPIPRTQESLIACDDVAGSCGSKGTTYLFDGSMENKSTPTTGAKHKDSSSEWALVRNQVFLGVLGSLVVPRAEIQKLLKSLSDAGVRFVYFSPRNMRRQKELAVQMGIDVAWNAAISLRPLESGEDDPHRMTSNYADWDVKAKLPHGVDDVRKHLEEVDNVPLLVSLFTDSTKETTREMVNVFLDYSDTVIVVGSTIPWNFEIFSTADVAIGIDIYNEGLDQKKHGAATPIVGASELEFASALTAHSCAFRFRGASSVSHMSSIIQQSRAALEAVTASSYFIVSGCLAFSFYVLLSVCNPSTAIPFVPTLGAVLFLQAVLPVLGFAMCLTKAEADIMKHVPPKNDQPATFQRREEKILYIMLVAKAIPPALLSAVMWLVAFGNLVFHLERDLVARDCPNAKVWANVLRCDALKAYSGPARVGAGALALSHLALCVIVSSASFVYRFSLIVDQPPFSGNYIWCAFAFLAVLLIALYLALTVEAGSRSALPWYYYMLSVINAMLCLIWNEMCKRFEAKAERRADKLRRLQFETRLGAWSPK